jgi:uncharacterized protein YacL
MRKAIRLLLTVVSSALGFVAAFYGANPLEKLLNTIFSQTMRWTIIGLSVVVGGILGYAVAPWLIRVVWKAIRWLEGKLRRTPLQDIFFGAIGLIIGLIIANLIGSAFSKVPGIGVIVPIAGSIILGYLGITIAIAKRDDVSGMFTRSGRDRSARTSGSLTTDSSIPKLLDTSVIIDGRIYDVCRTGFLEGPLLVPRFVLDELRHIADSSDMLKRNRGRRGLDVLGKLQKDLGATLQVYERDVAATYTEVDAKLVALAKELGGSVITNDFNLNKVAELQGVRVLNVNDLANSVKPVVLPGEEMRVHVIKDGKEVGQGVGYLDDGTMIVVDGGKRHIGDYIEVIVTSVLQTSAGRMIFARPKTADRATP